MSSEKKSQKSQKSVKSKIAAGVAAVGVATAAIFGINTTTETEVVPYAGEGRNDTRSFPTEEFENLCEFKERNGYEPFPTGEIQGLCEETEVVSYANEESGIWGINLVYDDISENEIEDLLKPYRTEKIVEGRTVYYYKDVPFELQGLLIKYANGGASAVSEISAYSQSDVSIMENYIFINTADGLKYLSDISDGTAVDEQIENADFTDFNVFVNANLGYVTGLKPIKSFNGLFYGNDFEFSTDNYLFENLTGKVERLKLTTALPIAENSDGGSVFDCELYIEGYAENNGIIGNAKDTKATNVYLECDISGGTVGGIFGKASGECEIKNCIVNGNLEADGEVGSFIGRLENEIVMQNNTANTTVTAKTGYGGKAIGFVSYEYADNIDRINGAYCETELTVFGIDSELFIGNIPEETPKIITKKEGLTTEEISAAATAYTVNGVATTIYNLAMLGGDLEYSYRTYTVAEYDENYPKLTGFYDFADIKAMNEYADAFDLRRFGEDGGSVYFEPKSEQTGIYFDNLVYMGGKCVAFINGEFDGGELIIATYIDDMMYSITTHEVSTGGTYFTELENSEEITEVKAFLWSGLDTFTPMCEAVGVNAMLMLMNEEGS